eukprot:TRINITY_DN1364_c1_g1_i1.p1 TRINITY_DN1364_c1_g1~~TRINITY_DN1364_c1_g1_i1.p1  ORF type:complete len:243 (+),score=37.04 TRINITY_DN1364_c1_g1_i1:63-731(+)
MPVCIEEVGVQEVAWWLKNHGAHGSEVLSFKENEADGRSLLKITGDDLEKEFGIKGRDRRKAISNAICELINKYKTYDYPSLLAQGSPVKAARLNRTEEGPFHIEGKVRIASLSCPKVVNLLRQHGAPQEALFRFKDNEVDGVCLLELEQADLSEELEISSFAVRKASWAAVTALLNRNDSTPPRHRVAAPSPSSTLGSSQATPHPLARYYRHFEHGGKGSA